MQESLILGENLKRIRTLKNIKQSDIAKSLGVSRAFICKIENGQNNPTLSTITKLCKVVGVTPDELLSGDKLPEQNKKVPALKNLETKTHKLSDDCFITNGDCIHGMSTIDEDTVNLILTDPPYNLGLFMQDRDTNLGAMRENHFAVSYWDHIEQYEWEINMDEFFKESARVLKKNGALLIFMSFMKVETLIRIAQSNGFYYKTTGVWHKKNPMPRNMNLHFVNSTEAWVYFINRGKTGIFNNEGKVLHDHIETSVINVGEKRHGKHPTQKPLPLMEHFVKVLANENDVILDPFMGSGSTGVAAVQNNRKFHGIELDKNYFNLSKNRLMEVIGTPKLIV
jgi:DNA modification methylase/DNA-binding XRE family transcriptional regulator